MSGVLMEATRLAGDAQKQLAAAKLEEQQATTGGERLLARDKSDRLANLVVAANAAVKSAAPLPPDMRPPANQGEMARAGFEGEVGLLDIAQRNGIPRSVLRAAADDGSRMEELRTRGGDPSAEAMRVINGALKADAPALLAGAKAMVARDPQLRAWLDRTGAGNSPWMIRHLGEEARRRGLVK